MSTTIQCSLQPLEEIPFWFINGSIYEFLSIPLFFPSISRMSKPFQLHITAAEPSLNNTDFWCAYFNADGDLVEENPIQLIVSRQYLRS